LPRRITAAFLVAPLVASAALAAGFRTEFPNFFSVSPVLASATDDSIFRDWFPVFLFSSLFVAYPSTLVVGLPTFFILRKRVALSFLNCILAGAFVASAPWIAIVLLQNPGYWSDGQGRIYHMAGHYTALGWIEVGKAILYNLTSLAPLGALGGLAFRLIAASTWKRERFAD
jgi:hypothetical protein